MISGPAFIIPTGNREIIAPTGTTGTLNGVMCPGKYLAAKPSRRGSSLETKEIT